MLRRAIPSAIFPLILSHFALAGGQDAGLRISTSPAQGLGAEAGVGRSHPSDLVRVEGRDYVLYTRLTTDCPLYPKPYTGEIWYAVSEDEGHSWREVGPVLLPGPEGAMDAVGVFEPNVLRWHDGSWYLFYSGVGPEFNFRFEKDTLSEPVRLFAARLSADPTSGTLSAERLAGGQPILEPVERSTRAFDSLRVDGVMPLIRNGYSVLVYRGRAFGGETAGTQLGVAFSADPTGPYERLHEGRTILPFGGEALVGVHEGGLFALLTGSERGLWWADDGQHFSRIDVRVNGRLDNPGIFRGDADGRLDAGEHRWGLHVGARRPDPFLERFELVVSGDIPRPRRATVPAPSAAAFASWTKPGWLAQHLRTLEQARPGKVDYVFLGDGIIEGFGGHDRVESAPGEATWSASFAGKKVHNLGVAGDRTEHVLWRLSHGAIEGVDARAVVVAVGDNQLDDDDPEDIVHGVAAIIERVRYEHPGSDVVLVSGLRRPDSDELRLERTAAFNRGLLRLARDPNIHYLDLDDALAGSGGRVGLDFVDVDGRHLSADGYRRWSDALLPLLEAIDEPVPEQAHRRLQEIEGTDRE